MAFDVNELLGVVAPPDGEDPSIQFDGFSPSRQAVTSALVSGQEVEVPLTPELQKQMPVINNLRGSRGSVSGVTNFLSNPEVQNAFLQFAKAFGKNNPNTPGVILANAGEDMLKGDANARALKAAQENGNIAGAAGRFADPGLVAGLQDRQAQATLAQSRLKLDQDQYTAQLDQFDEEMAFRYDQATAQNFQASNDYLLNMARLNFDREEFIARREFLRKDHELASRRADSEIAYQRYLASPEANPERTAAATNNFLKIIDDQEENIKAQVTRVGTILTQIPSDEEFSGWFGEDTMEAGQRHGASAAKAGVRIEGNLSAQQVRERVTQELLSLNTRLERLREERQLIATTQSNRLTAASNPASSSAGAGAGSNPLPPVTPRPGATKETAITSTVGQARQQPVNSYINVGGTVWFWDGKTLTSAD